jgi:hypothetical protein
MYGLKIVEEEKKIEEIKITEKVSKVSLKDEEMKITNPE